MIAEVLKGYAAEAGTLVPNFETISSAELYAVVAHLLPKAPARIADIGAGTGRDAAWFSSQGHAVLAVEPVRELREAGMALHPGPGIDWVDDSLPDLARVLARGGCYDCVLLSGVWQHLDAGRRCSAMPALAALTAPGGLLILSVRHGPGAPSRPCFEADPEDTIESAATCGLALALRATTDSIQAANRAAGVTWTWLAFSALAPRPRSGASRAC